MKHINFFVMFFLLLINTSCALLRERVEVHPDGLNFYTLKHPYDRFENPDAFFKKEYQQINKRRKSNKTGERPLNLVGLAQSGGGIRSAAFHLGLLSGFNKGSYRNSSILKRIDYISSVSGGTWANGAYWAWDKTDDELFSCLDKAAENGFDNAVNKFGCSKNIVGMLRHYQGVRIIPFNKDTWWFEQRKEKWEQDIIKYYLTPGRNIDFSTFTWEGGFQEKHYPIFNSTHDAVSELGTSVNLPFETTPDYFGTIIDFSSEDKSGEAFCDKGRINSQSEKKVKREVEEECAKSRIGFFAAQNSSNFSWWNRKWQRHWKFWDSTPDVPGANLSKVMAHSSGVVGKDLSFALSYNFDLRYQDNYISNLRKYYQLVDGGKSDNLGVIPLVERQLDLIIVSHMGKEDPVEGSIESIEDYKLAGKQVEKLFGCQLEPDTFQDDLVVEGRYLCSGDQTGIMVHVKPTYTNIKKFRQALGEDSVCRPGSRCKEDLLVFLEKEEDRLDQEDRFPQSKTFTFEYEEELVRAYYLLGRYIAETELNIIIRKYLAKLGD